MKLMRRIAKQVRTDLEVINQELRHWPANLCGACMTGTKLLQQRLRKQGIPTQMWLGKVKSRPDCSHAWLETDKYLVDVTFTQFAKAAPKVVLIYKQRPEYQAYRQLFFNESLITNRTFFDWPPSQNPHTVTGQFWWRRLHRKAAFSLSLLGALILGLKFF